ncbi:MAG: GTPase HflX [Bacteroidota bacterium]
MIEKKKYHTTAQVRERAILVGLITQKQTADKLQEYMDELQFLAETAGAETIQRFTQKVEHPHSGTFVGSGKLEELKMFVVHNNIDMVIFDDELSPSQLRNIEREFNPSQETASVKILDRTNLILDIFAQRATSSYARTQVELAQYNYLLPRLTRMWTHLERQKGGIGLRGPGESQIESDRRAMKQRVTLLKEELKVIDRQMAQQRSNRGELVRVALVGYTNVGKSTIMNLIAKSEVFAENKLFATLDTTVRKVVLENLPFLLSDTVGFIRKLPHQLVQSFKSTLDEVREADLLLHVVDISHPQFEDHYNTVNATLAELGASDKPTLLIFNKIDKYEAKDRKEFDLSPVEADEMSLEELESTWMARILPNRCLFISATEKLHVDELRNTLYETIKSIHAIRYPYNNFLY